MFRPVIATTVAVLGTAAGSLITESSIDLKTLGAVASVVLPATWYLSRRYTRIEDRLNELEKAIGEMPCTKAHTVLVKPVVRMIPVCEQAETVIVEPPKKGKGKP